MLCATCWPVALRMSGLPAFSLLHSSQALSVKLPHCPAHAGRVSLRLRQGWRRYWAAELWDAFFGAMLNAASATQAPPTAQLLAAFEAHFASNPAAARKLRTELRRVVSGAGAGARGTADSSSQLMLSASPPPPNTAHVPHSTGERGPLSHSLPSFPWLPAGCHVPRLGARACRGGSYCACSVEQRGVGSQAGMKERGCVWSVLKFCLPPFLLPLCLGTPWLLECGPLRYM